MRFVNTEGKAYFAKYVNPTNLVYLVKFVKKTLCETTRAC